MYAFLSSLRDEPELHRGSRELFVLQNVFILQTHFRAADEMNSTSKISFLARVNLLTNRESSFKAERHETK